MLPVLLIFGVVDLESNSKRQYCCIFQLPHRTSSFACSFTSRYIFDPSLGSHFLYISCVRMSFRFYSVKSRLAAHAHMNYDQPRTSYAYVACSALVQRRYRTHYRHYVGALHLHRSSRYCRRLKGDHEVIFSNWSHQSLRFRRWCNPIPLPAKHSGLDGALVNLTDCDAFIARTLKLRTTESICAVPLCAGSELALSALREHITSLFGGNPHL